MDVKEKEASRSKVFGMSNGEIGLLLHERLQVEQIWGRGRIKNFLLDS